MQKRYPLGLLSIFVISGCVAFSVGGEIQSGRTALMKGEPDLALMHFQRAAQLDPDYLTDFTPLQEGVWTYVGRAYYVAGKLPEARQALERALSRYEHDSLAKLYLGLTLIRQQKDEKAENPFSMDDIIYALKEGVAPKRVVNLIQERGVGFELTSERENSLRRVGADDQLVEEIKRIRVEFEGKRRAEGLLRERGLKEVEAALRELHNWLEYISGNTSFGRFWDPAREIRSEIQTNLTMISGKKIDLQKLVANAEWLGQKMEEEIDLARRDQLQERAIRRR